MKFNSIQFERALRLAHGYGHYWPGALLEAYPDALQRIWVPEKLDEIIPPDNCGIERPWVGDGGMISHRTGVDGRGRMEWEVWLDGSVHFRVMRPDQYGDGGGHEIVNGEITPEGDISVNLAEGREEEWFMLHKNALRHFLSCLFPKMEVDAALVTLPYAKDDQPTHAYVFDLATRYTALSLIHKAIEEGASFSESGLTEEQARELALCALGNDTNDMIALHGFYNVGFTVGFHKLHEEKENAEISN